MDIMSIGATPLEETCAQVGSIDYEARSIRECRVFRRMLERIKPVPPGVKAQYRIKAFAHDFGSYREVCVQYDANDAAAVEFTYGLEASTPARWDDLAIAELLWFENRALYAQKLAKGDIDDLDVPEVYRTAAPPEGITLEALIQSTTAGRGVEPERVAA